MDTLGTVAAAWTGAIFLAVVLERLVELLVKPKFPQGVAWLIPYIAVVAGLLVAFGFNLDVIEPTLAELGIVPAVSWAGTLLTGLIIGGGSNLVHDLLSTITGD
jgi:hypothetical protein